ncbi:hypothetical protein AX15_000316 [Amanita polypyramis BW_CC]|nr:hypothetical protein AX15_000316 [Amanita polypyramis BW_CC]
MEAMSTLVKLPFIFLVTAGLHITYTAPIVLPQKEEQVSFRDGPISMRQMIKGKYVFWIMSILEAGTILKGLLTRREVMPLYLTATSIVGAILVVGGAYLRYRCYKTMGSMFTFEVTIQENHRLVKDGPYGVVRHPSYTGAIAVMSGSLLWYLTPGSFTYESTALARKIFVIAVAGVLIVAASFIPRRIGKEDEMLRERFGAEWDDWTQRVRYKLIPGVY